MKLLTFSLLSCLLVAGLGARAQKRPMPPKPAAGQVVDSAGQPAVPVGGTERYAQFLAEHQRYPASALQKGLQGTVRVSFIVEKTGYLNQVQVAQPVAPELDAEGIRLIQSGPRWTPAKDHGVVVRQRVVVPISFVLSPGSVVAMRPAKERPITTSAADIAASAHPGRPAVVAPDRPTQPVGGTQAFFDWIEKNQQYPDAARQRGIAGKVMMEFMVEKDGSLTDPRVLRRVGGGLDEEALRLIRVAPKWEPAMLQGKPIKQKMVLPVLFQL